MTESKSKAKKAMPVAFFATVLLSGFLGYSISNFFFKMPGVKASLPALNALDALALLILVLVVLAIHELGHLVGGFSRGMKFLLFVVGPFQWIKTPDGIRFSLVFNLGSFGGLAAAMPNPDKDLGLQMKRLVLGGPLASLALGFVCLIAGVLLHGKPAIYFYFVAGFSFLIFVVTALPFRAGGFMSDGMQFLELRRGGTGVEERQNIIMLMTQGMAGVRPRDLDMTIIGRMLASNTADPMRQVIARYYAYMASLDRDEHELAAEYIHWIEGHIEQYPQGFRQALTLEICLHYVLRRELEQARSWMKKSSGGIVDESRRSLVEAEFALLENNKEQAAKALAKARKLSVRNIDVGIRIMTLEQITQAEQKIV